MANEEIEKPEIEVAFATFVTSLDDEDVVNDAMIEIADSWDVADVLEAGLTMLASDEPERRMFGASLIRDKLIRPDVDVPSALYGPRLRAALTVETDDDALAFIVAAFRAASDPEALEPLCRLVNHHDADVRYGVAGAIASCMAKQLRVNGMQALSLLADDQDSEVRYSARYELISLWHHGPERSDQLWSLIADYGEDADDRVREIFNDPDS